MVPPNDRGYSQDRSYDPPHASSYFDQYLEAARSSYSSFDSVGSQSVASSFAAASDPTWFTEFIAYGSDDSDFQADSMSVSSTSGSVRMELSSDMATIPLFASSPRAVPVSTDTGVPNNTSFCRWPYLTDLDEACYAVVFGSSMPNSPWNPTEPALNLSASSRSESSLAEDMEQVLLENSISVQNDAAGKSPVPRMRYFTCPTCNTSFSNEPRLSKHLLKSHAPVRFTCDTCDKGFKQKKDLKRHQLTHEPSRQPFACSCRKTYARYDGLLRHVTDMDSRPREAGRHKAIKSNPR